MKFYIFLTMFITSVCFIFYQIKMTREDTNLRCHLRTILPRKSENNSPLAERYFLRMFITAVCYIFLIKLRWPKKISLGTKSGQGLTVVSQCSYILMSCGSQD